MSRDDLSKFLAIIMVLNYDLRCGSEALKNNDRKFGNLWGNLRFLS
jgi:hypothetical protein